MSGFTFAWTARFATGRLAQRPQVKFWRQSLAKEEFAREGQPFFSRASRLRENLV
jgi:hypothetical protein